MLHCRDNEEFVRMSEGIAMHHTIYFLELHKCIGKTTLQYFNL